MQFRLYSVLALSILIVNLVICLDILDEPVSIRLMQHTEYTDSGRVLAYYESSVKNFLYPHPTFSSTYDTSVREVLMDRSLEFPVSFTATLY